MSRKKKVSKKKKGTVKTFDYVRLMGVSLSGGKSDKTFITILDYYTDQNKLVVSRVIDRIKSEGDISADLKFFDLINEYKTHLIMMAWDVPLSLPKCFRCELSCPGYEACDEEEIMWMWKNHRQMLQKQFQLRKEAHLYGRLESPDHGKVRHNQKELQQEFRRFKNQKLFTPYTRRCAEEYWSPELEGAWSINDALGSNEAPLLARSQFLIRRLKKFRKIKMIEVIPRLSLLRWSKKAKLINNIVTDSRNSLKGLDSRDYVMKKAIEDLKVFIYEQDKAILVDSLHAFDSFWAALTAFWKYQDQCESPPKSFPKRESWIDVPK